MRRSACVKGKGSHEDDFFLIKDLEMLLFYIFDAFLRRFIRLTICSGKARHREGSRCVCVGEGKRKERIVVRKTSKP